MVLGHLRVADVGVSLVDDPHTSTILESAARLRIVQRPCRDLAVLTEIYCSFLTEAIDDKINWVFFYLAVCSG